MNAPCLPLASLVACAALLLGSALSSHGQVLLFNPGDNTVGPSTLPDASTPYTVATNSIWNNGLFNLTNLKYADNTNATGVEIKADGTQISSNTALIEFNNPSGVISSPGTPSVGEPIFNTDPSLDMGFFNSPTSVLGYKFTNLPKNIAFDVYVVAAYVGQNSVNHPGRSSAASMAVFGFAGSDAATVTYTYSAGGAQITGAGSPVNSFQVLTNTNNSTWIENNNFEKFQVTLTDDNPSLYVIVSAQQALAGMATTAENRPFLNLVQIVAVPEPGVGAALACGIGLLAFARQRRRR